MAAPKKKSRVLELVLLLAAVLTVGLLFFYLFAFIESPASVFVHHELATSSGHPTQAKVSVCVVLPQSSLPNWFLAFLQGVKRNSNFDFLIFHEAREIPEDLPINSRFFPFPPGGIAALFASRMSSVLGTFDATEELEATFHSSFSLYPTSVHVLSPAYGSIFQDYLMNYTHWATYSDVAMIPVSLAALIPSEKLFDEDVLALCSSQPVATTLCGKFVLHRNQYPLNELWTSLGVFQQRSFVSSISTLLKRRNALRRVEDQYGSALLLRGFRVRQVQQIAEASENVALVGLEGRYVVLSSSCRSCVALLKGEASHQSAVFGGKLVPVFPNANWTKSQVDLPSDYSVLYRSKNAFAQPYLPSYAFSMFDLKDWRYAFNATTAGSLPDFFFLVDGTLESFSAREDLFAYIRTWMEGWMGALLDGSSHPDSPAGMSLSVFSTFPEQCRDPEVAVLVEPSSPKKLSTLESARYLNMLFWKQECTELSTLSHLTATPTASLRGSALSSGPIQRGISVSRFSRGFSLLSHDSSLEQILKCPFPSQMEKFSYCLNWCGCSCCHRINAADLRVLVNTLPPSSTSDLTLVTVVTPERLAHAMKLGQAFSGPKVFVFFEAVQVGGTEGFDAAMQRVLESWKDAEAMCGKLENVLLVAYAVINVGTEFFYIPINTLRQIGVDMSRTRFVLPLDGDFVPSKNLESFFEDHVDDMAAMDRAAFVVPQFRSFLCSGRDKTKKRTFVANSFPELRSFVEMRLVEPFHGDNSILDRNYSRSINRSCHQSVRDGSALAPTEYRRWWKESHTMGGLYHVNPRVTRKRDFSKLTYEPYVIVSKSNFFGMPIPPYEQRFVGYTRNKISWVTALRCTQYMFYVIRQVFVTHLPHSFSSDRVHNRRHVERHHKKMMQFFIDYVDSLFDEYADLPKRIKPPFSIDELK